MVRIGEFAGDGQVFGELGIVDVAVLERGDVDRAGDVAEDPAPVFGVKLRRQPQRVRVAGRGGGLDAGEIRGDQI